MSLAADVRGGPAQPWPVAIDQLQLGETLREHAVQDAHVRTLVDTAGRWAPILVYGDTNVVIDGRHRVAAARQLGMETIAVVRFQGTEREAFVESVRRNVEHGLTLTLRERERAARRILQDNPPWSDRRVAQLCAVAARTVARIRRELVAGSDPSCPSAAFPRLDTRIGRDGRLRPVRAVAARERIVQALEARPEASLRCIAAEVEVSPETVRSVRNTLLSGGHPHSDRAAPKDSKSSDDDGDGLAACRLVGVVDPSQPEGTMVRDPAFSSRPDSARFATWFESTAMVEQWFDLLDAVPLSRIYEVADEARRRAAEWADFARALEGRGQRQVSRR